MNDRQELNDITFLVEQLRTSSDNAILKQAAKRLGVICAGNSDAINALIYLVRATPDEPTRWVGIQSLGQIGIGNREVIETLIEQLNVAREPTRRIAAQSLAKIAVGDRDTINALANLAKTNSDEITREAIAYTLGYIGKGDRNATNTLIYLIYNSSDQFTHKKCIDSLRLLGDWNEDTLDALIHFVKITQNYSYNCFTRGTLLDAIKEIGVPPSVNFANTRQLLAEKKQQIRASR